MMSAGALGRLVREEPDTDDVGLVLVGASLRPVDRSIPHPSPTRSG